MHDRPLIILVTGAPGSGKSTLASAIAEHMRLPHIERDVIFRGISLTNGAKIDHKLVGIPAYYSVIKGMLDHNMSLVTDGTMYKGISESDIKEHFVSRAFVVNLHTRARNEKERFRKRELARTFTSSDWVDGHMKRLDEIYADTVDPLEYGVDCIEVDTNDGYTPTLEQLADDIMQRYDKSIKET
jgi:cytidylate kinase